MNCRHGPGICRSRRGNLAANSSAPLCLSLGLALEAQSPAGARQAAGAGPAGNPGENAGPAAPASAPTSGVTRARRRQARTTPPHGAMRRGRWRQEIWRTTPPPQQIRLRPGARFSGRTPPFENLPAKFPEAPLNLFHAARDILLPGILHHSGNRPAPPSEHTPLARRSAFYAASRILPPLEPTKLFGSAPVGAGGAARSPDANPAREHASPQERLASSACPVRRAPKTLLPAPIIRKYTTLS